MFLAAEPTLRRMATPWWKQTPVVWRRRGPRPVKQTPFGPEYGRSRLGELAMACELVAGRLTPAERERLRATGELPAWFLDAVREEDARANRRVRRGDDAG